MISEEKKQNYIAKVHRELVSRGLNEEDIPKVIAKTGFIAALNEYPEEQMLYDVADAVDEILMVAATR